MVSPSTESITMRYNCYLCHIKVKPPHMVVTSSFNGTKKLQIIWHPECYNKFMKGTRYGV